MLTDWGKRVLSIIKTANVVPNVTVSSTSQAMIEAKTIAGNIAYIPPVPQIALAWGFISSDLIESGSSASVGIAVGSSRNVDSENNYTLGNQITGLSAATPTIESYFDIVRYKYVARLDILITNDTGTAVTVNEMGVFARFNKSSTLGDNASSAATNRVCVMIDRTVLDKPVTIASGEAAVVRYEFAY